MTTPTLHDCPECGGSGEISWLKPNATSGDQIEHAACENCGGNGQIDAETLAAINRNRLNAIAPQILEALEGAVDMLNTIANGKTYSAQDYLDRLAAYKATLAHAKGGR